MLSDDAASSSTALPAFDDCADALLEEGVLMSPAELHGALCGLLGGGVTGEDADILSALEGALSISLTGAAATCGSRLYGATRELFESAAYRFQPLLPDDDMELTQRVASLAAWCRGYLGGYAQARIATAGADRPVAADSAEVLRDFAAIAQAAVDDDEGRSGAGGDDDEAAEHHYVELVEYLRAATLTIMADAHAPAPDTRGPQGAGGTSH